MNKEAEDMYKRAIDLNPADPRCHIKLGQLYRILKDSASSKKEFQKAILLDLNNLSANKRAKR